MILVTHIRDIDGMGSAIIAKSLDSKTKVKYVDYPYVKETVERLLKDVSNDELIVMTDIHLKEENVKLADKLDERGNVLLFDHHINPAGWMKERYDWATVSEDKCGTWLFWENLEKVYGKNLKVENAKRKYKNLVKLINDRDLWINQFPKSEEINLLFNLMGIERFVNRFVKNPKTEFTEGEKLLLDIEKQNKEKYINSRKVYFKNVEGIDFAICFANKYISELGHKILDEYSDVDVFMAIVTDINSSDTPTVSMRSRKGQVDVSSIAKQNGGGGHPSAAGYPIKEYKIEDFLEAVMPTIDLIWF